MSDRRAPESVAQARDRLAEAARVSVAQRPLLLDEVHRLLQEALADVAPGTAAPVPGRTAS